MNKFKTINYVITVTYVIKSHRSYCRKEVYLRRKMLFPCLVWERKPANHNLHLMTFKAMKPVFICDKFSVCLHLSNWCQPLWLIVSEPIIFCCKKNYWNAFCKYRGKIFQMISWNNINIKICNCCIMQMKPHVLDAQNFYNDFMLWSLIYVRQ